MLLRIENMGVDSRVKVKSGTLAEEQLFLLEAIASKFDSKKGTSLSVRVSELEFSLATKISPLLYKRRYC